MTGSCTIVWRFIRTSSFACRQMASVLVCVCVCVVRVCACVYVGLFVYVGLCACVYVCVWESQRERERERVGAHAQECSCVRTCTYVFPCLYVLVCAYAHTHAPKQMWMCICVCMWEHTFIFFLCMRVMLRACAFPQKSQASLSVSLWVHQKKISTILDVVIMHPTVKRCADESTSWKRHDLSTHKVFQ